MARRLGDEDDEYGLEDDENEGLIELSGRRSRGRGMAHHAEDPNPSSSCRWMTVLFLLALAGVYHLGLKEGKNELKIEGDEEDVDMKPDAAGGAGGGSNTGKTSNNDGGAPGPAPSKTGAFTLDKLKATRDEANNVINMLDTYYTNKEQATKMLMQPWLDQWSFNADGTDVQKDRADKLVDTMTRALVTDSQTTFLMGGIGSSVMAGHDNCHYDSYQTQMERLWSPVWKAAGMDFVFQNAGEGGGCGDSHENQHWCVKQNVSPDVDVVHYEWTYFEHGQAQKQHEDLVRWCQMLPKQPPVHIFNTGTLPAIGSSDTVIAEHYAKYGFNAFYMRTGFDNGGHDYNAEKNADKDAFDRFSWGYVGDGYHDTTRYGEKEDEARKNSLGVVMRNWHPGPMGFQLTSDAFTYVYTHALLKALDLIEKEMNDGNDVREKWSSSERPLLMKNDLPEPKYCDELYCVVDEVPGCLNYELPTFGNWGPRVEDPDDDLNPYPAGETQKWSVWQEDNNLWKMVGKVDTAIFKDRDDKEQCRHLDACGGISAQKKDDGMVVFRLPKMEVGLVVICGCCGKAVGQDMFMNNQDIEISYNTVPLDHSTWDIWPNGKCVRLLKKFPTSGRMAETPTGHAYLGVKVLNDMKQPVRISHVITL